MDIFIPIYQTPKLKESSISYIFDPLQIEYNKDFLVLSNIDYIINFTQNLGNYIVPHNIDSDYHVFNISSRKGYTDYIQYRRPAGYIYLFEPLIESFTDIEKYLKSENIQVFIHPESFTDITRTRSYPDTIIIENKVIESFDINSLIHMLRGVQIKDRTSFLIIQVNEGDEIQDKTLKALISLCSPSPLRSPGSLHKLQDSIQESQVFLCIPSSLYSGYFIILAVNSTPEASNSTYETQIVDVEDITKRLKTLSKTRRSIDLNVFPYYKFIDWNITHYHPEGNRA